MQSGAPSSILGGSISFQNKIKENKMTQATSVYMNSVFGGRPSEQTLQLPRSYQPGIGDRADAHDQIARFSQRYDLRVESIKDPRE